MKESAFRSAVLAKLPAFVHRQPMLASHMSFPGTPDTYFDYRTDLWAEFKALRRDNHLPERLPKEALPTEAQFNWLTRRSEAGSNAIVMIGFKLKGRIAGMLLPREYWKTPMLRSEYEILLHPPAILAGTILNLVTLYDHDR